MQKILASILAGILCSAVALAQDHPRMDAFLGYTWMRANSATNVPAFSANGGSGQFGINFNKWVGFVTDIGATHNGNIGGAHLDSTFTNYLFGPRVTFRNSRVTPYLQTLFGGMGAGTSVDVPSYLSPPPTVSNPIYLPGVGYVTDNGPVSLRAVAHQTAFAMAFGGGLDIRMSRHVSFRPIGLDYFMTRLQNIRSLNDNNQHNIRYTTGINFTFGAQ